MDELRYTLVAEGSSDAALIPILNWLLIENGVNCPIQPARADLGTIPNLPKRPKLSDKIKSSLSYYPCDLLFVHRDSDRDPREKREQEIQKAVDDLPEDLLPLFVCVTPRVCHPNSDA